MATHPSVLAVKIPWTEEPAGYIQSTGCRVGLVPAHTQTHIPKGPAATGGVRAQAEEREPHLLLGLGNHSHNKHGTGG